MVRVVTDRENAGSLLIVTTHATAAWTDVVRDAPGNITVFTIAHNGSTIAFMTELATRITAGMRSFIERSQPGMRESTIGSIAKIGSTSLPATWIEGVRNLDS